MGYGYDANGNMTNDGQFAYVWDEADRLVAVRSLESGQTVMSEMQGSRAKCKGHVSRIKN